MAGASPDSDALPSSEEKEGGAGASRAEKETEPTKFCNFNMVG